MEDITAKQKPKRIPYGMMNFVDVRNDKEFAHDASVIQTLVSQGFVTGELKEGFPAERIADTVNANAHIAHTQLHKVYVVYRGVEMVACEEV